MAFEILREFVSILRFKLDDAGLVEMNTRLNDARANIKSSIGGFEQLAHGARRAGLAMSAFISAPMALFVKDSMQAAAMMEKYIVQYSVLTGSMKEAKGLMTDLVKFESKTPFTVPQVMKFAQQLLIAKEPAKNLVNQLRLIGDISLGDPHRMDRTIYALSQVRQLGYLTGMERRQFTEALVPMSKALEQLTGKTGQEVTKMITKRMISADMVQQALELIGKERLGALQKASQTLTGLWTTLVSAVWRLHAAFGEMIERSIGVKVIVQGLTTVLNGLAWIVKHMPPGLTTIISLFMLFLIVVPPLILLLGTLSWAYMHLAGVIFVLKGSIAALNVPLDLMIIKLVALRTWFLTTAPVIALFIAGVVLSVAFLVSWLLILQDVWTYVFGGKQHTMFPAWYTFFEKLGAKIHRVVMEVEKLMNLLLNNPVTKIILKYVNPFSKEAVGYEPAAQLVKQGVNWWNKQPDPVDMFGRPMGGKQISNVFHINMPVPAGTTEQQKQHLSTHIKDLFDQKLYENLNAAAVQ